MPLPMLLQPSLPPVTANVDVLPPKGLNTRLYLDINNFARHTGWAHGFMHAYALWLGAVILAALFLVAFAVAWWRRAPRASALLVLGGIGTVVALGLNQLVGHAARELRPYATHPSALVLVGRTTDYSFPSDHSIVAGGLTASILLVAGGSVWLRRRPGAAPPTRAGAGAVSSPVVIRVLAVLAVVLGLFLCFARVYVGAHYPGDVVAGYLLSAGVVVVISLLRPWAYWVVDRLDATPAGIVVRRPGGPPVADQPDDRPGADGQAATGPVADGQAAWSQGVDGQASSGQAADGRAVPAPQ